MAPGGTELCLMRSGRGWSAGVGGLARSEAETVQFLAGWGPDRWGHRQTSVCRSDRVVEAGTELADETVFVDEVQRCILVTMRRRNGLPGQQKEGEQAQGRSFPGENFANPVHWDFEAP